jgi:hypothetical protein
MGETVRESEYGPGKGSTENAEERGEGRGDGSGENIGDRALPEGTERFSRLGIFFFAHLDWNTLKGSCFVAVRCGPTYRWLDDKARTLVSSPRLQLISKSSGCLSSIMERCGIADDVKSGVIGVVGVLRRCADRFALESELYDADDVKDGVSLSIALTGPRRRRGRGRWKAV